MKRLALLAFCATALLAIPAFASAATLCVNTVSNAGCDATYPQANLQDALDDAGADAVNDTVKIGPGDYTGAFDYLGTGGSSSILIQGAGQGQTVLRVPDNGMNQSAMEIVGPQSTLEGLTVVMNPSNSNGDIGISAQAATVQHVTVDGNGSVNTRGISAIGATLADISISQTEDVLSGTTGVSSGGISSITGAQITAAEAITFSDPGGTLNVSRAALTAGYRGIRVDQGIVNVDDTLIDLGANNSAGGLEANNTNANTAAKSINANHVTIVGGGSNSFGAKADALNASAVQTTSLTLANSIISGPQTALIRRASNTVGTNSSSTLTTSYSNYDATAVVDTDGTNGTGGPIAGDHQTNLPPGFADGPGGDFHLTGASALVDAGDPAAGGPSSDLDGGARVIDGNNDFVDRRDLGAYELPDTTAPAVQITSGPPATTSDPALSFSFASPDPTATFECRFDSDPFAPCSTSSSHTQTVSGGMHTFEVRATDHFNNSTTASQVVTVEVPTPPGDTPPGDTPPGDTPPDSNPPPDTKAPKTTIAGSAKVRTTKKHVRVSFSADDPMATFECKFDSGAFAPCASPYRTPKLKPGRHTVTVRATDAAGNVEAAPPALKIKMKPHHKGGSH